jgi:glycosyltransferase involved in cell wall biosynthesis
MPKILVNLYKLKNTNNGLGQVALNMGKYLSSLPNAEDFILLVPEKYIGFFGDRVSYIRSNFFNKYFSFHTGEINVLHLIHQLSPKRASGKTKTVLTIHDLNFIFEKKSDSKRNKYLRKVQKKVDRADALIFISGFTKNFSNKHLNIPDSKVQKVIYNGVEIDTDKQTEKPAFLPPGDFLFTIGEIKNKKNFHVLIGFLKKLQHPYNLVIAGNSTSDYADSILKLAEKENLTDRVILPGMISEDDKIYLYRHCKAFVFPSLYEGFGLPVIEAMRFGKPVFSSTSTSLPEIGGKLAFYWDNFDPAYMADVFTEKMELYLSDPKYAEKLMEYSSAFTWEKSIKEYNDLYSELIKKP